jgi:hypothetical protein
MIVGDERADDGQTEDHQQQAEHDPSPSAAYKAFSP